MTIRDAIAAPTDHDETESRWRLLRRVTGIAGLASFVLILGPIIAASGQEPGFVGGGDEVLAYFRSTSGSGFQLGRFLVTVGLIGFLWFAVGLALQLAEAEGRPAWRSAVAVVSAVPVAVLNLNGMWQAAAHRADGLTDPGTALLAFDVGNAAFSNSWVALGSFAIAAGLVMATGRFQRRWLGWVGILAGVGLISSRALWTDEIWFGPYAVFWIWTIMVCVRLLRGRP